MPESGSKKASGEDRPAQNNPQFKDNNLSGINDSKRKTRQKSHRSILIMTHTEVFEFSKRRKINARTLQQVARGSQPHYRRKNYAGRNAFQKKNAFFRTFD